MDYNKTMKELLNELQCKIIKNTIQVTLNFLCDYHEFHNNITDISEFLASVKNELYNELKIVK